MTGKFAVVSDVHAEQHNDWSRLVFQRLGARKDLDFVAFLGDVCTSPGDDWEKWFRPLQDMIGCKLMACRGNHDDAGRFWKWFDMPADFVHVQNGARFVFWDSNDWKHDGEKSRWLMESCAGPETRKFLFTHLSPRIGHWNYGLGPNRTSVLLDVCRRNKVTACFTGHMHGFDVLKQDGTFFFICGGGGGGRHDNFPVMHRSNYYLLVEFSDTEFNVSICQQHREREQVRTMSEWIDEARSPAF